jgi:hypothetical protein
VTGGEIAGGALKALIERGPLMVVGATVAAGSAVFLAVPALRAAIGTGWTVCALVGLVFGGLLFLISGIARLATYVGARAAAARQAQRSAGFEITGREMTSHWIWHAHSGQSELHVDLNVFNRGAQTLFIVEAGVASLRTRPGDYLHRHWLVFDPASDRARFDAPIRGHSTRKVFAILHVKRRLGAPGRALVIGLALRSQDGARHVGRVRLKWLDPPEGRAPTGAPDDPPARYGYSAALPG